MKRYISVVLIFCMIIQMYGCYTIRHISKEEILANFGKEPIEVFTTDKREFVLKKNITLAEIEKYPNINYCSDFKIIPDTMVLYKSKVGFTNIKDKDGFTIKNIETDSVFIPDKLISDIKFSELDLDSSSNTIVFVGASVILTVALILVILNYGIKFKRLG